jgi:hypothetical protein
MIKGEQAELAMNKVRQYRAQGMSLSDMSRQTGIGVSKFAEICKGKKWCHGQWYPVHSMHRATWERIMAMQFVAPSGCGRVDPTGTRRRMQALAMAGYPLPFLEPLLNRKIAELGRIACGEQGKTYVHARLAEDVYRVYRRLINAKPDDFGISPASQRRVITFAKKRGYAPDHCWDSDTIDDPAAIPEWTGACGTYQGYWLHRNHGIPLCDPCRKALGERRNELKGPRAEHNCKTPIEQRVREYVADVPGATYRQIVNNVTGGRQDIAQARQRLIDRGEIRTQKVQIDRYWAIAHYLP